MMRVKIGLILIVLGIVGLLSLPAVKTIFAKGGIPGIVPLPESIEQHKGYFGLTPQTRIVSDGPSRQTSDYLAERLRRSSGYALPITIQSNSSAKGPSVLITSQGARKELGTEGYELNVSPDAVSLRAPASAGLFYGVQTLLQLLPPDIFSAHVGQSGKWTMPCVHIEDKPRFAWRGLMLDVSRHFFNKDEIKKVLEVMALHKLNTFHWHLTDDQGWRIEIKKYPRLTEIGAWREKIGFNLDPKSSTAYGPDGRYGGYYTQRDVGEIVAFAESRHITIVPEIEMPGHATAALAAYPGFSCSGEPYFTDMNLNTSAGVFCAGKEATFEFLQDVLTEVIELFPGKYIHIGGDEVPKQNWKHCEQCQARLQREGLKNEHELQSYFIRRIDTADSSGFGDR